MNNIFNTKDYQAIAEKSNGVCWICGSSFMLDIHHIIFRNKVQNGTNHIDNLILLCRNCHTIIHHTGDNNKLQQETYKLLPFDLSTVWKAKIKPKVIRLIEYYRSKAS